MARFLSQEMTIELFGDELDAAMTGITGTLLLS